jgi:hypothetical protein
MTLVKIRRRSTHSQRIEPITGSMYAYCQGDRAAVMISVLSVASTRLRRPEPYSASRSRSR